MTVSLKKDPYTLNSNLTLELFKISTALNRRERWLITHQLRSTAEGGSCEPNSEPLEVRIEMLEWEESKGLRGLLKKYEVEVSEMAE